MYLGVLSLLLFISAAHDESGDYRYLSILNNNDLRLMLQERCDEDPVLNSALNAAGGDLSREHLIDLAIASDQRIASGAPSQFKKNLGTKVHGALHTVVIRHCVG